MTWLDEIKAGDIVYVDQRFSGPRTVRVERVTATQIVTDGTRYRRTDGYEIGGDRWSTGRILEPTLDVVEGHRRDVLSQRLRTTDWRKLPLATLEAVHAILQSAVEKTS